MSRIVGWLRSVGSYIKAGVSRVEDVFEDVIDAVVSFFENGFYAIGSAWSYVVNGARSIADDVGELATSAYNGLRWIKNHLFAPFATWVKAKFIAAGRALENAVLDFGVRISSAVKSLMSLLEHTTRWVLDKVYTPLHDAVTAVNRWLKDNVYFIVDLFKNPSRLANFLLAPVWKAALAFFRANTSRIAGLLAGSFFSLLMEGVGFIEEVAAKLI